MKEVTSPASLTSTTTQLGRDGKRRAPRSEERRGGKEGRAQWARWQAEDGIRGLYVTGVQTCALPILPNRREKRLAKHGDPACSRDGQLRTQNFDDCGIDRN